MKRAWPIANAATNSFSLRNSKPELTTNERGRMTGRNPTSGLFLAQYSYIAAACDEFVNIYATCAAGCASTKLSGFLMTRATSSGVA